MDFGANEEPSQTWDVWGCRRTSWSCTGWSEVAKSLRRVMQTIFLDLFGVHVWCSLNKYIICTSMQGLATILGNVWKTHYSQVIYIKINSNHYRIFFLWYKYHFINEHGPTVRLPSPSTAFVLFFLIKLKYLWHFMSRYHGYPFRWNLLSFKNFSWVSSSWWNWKCKLHWISIHQDMQYYFSPINF